MRSMLFDLLFQAKTDIFRFDLDADVIVFVPEIGGIENVILFIFFCADDILVVVALIDELNDVAASAALVGVVADFDVLETDFDGDIHVREIDFFTVRGDEIAFLVEMGTGVKGGDIAIEFAVAENDGIFFGDVAVVLIDGEFFFHDVDIVGAYVHADDIADLTALRALNDHFGSADHSGDLIVNAFKYDADYAAREHTVFGLGHNDVFGADDHVDFFIFFVIVDALEVLIAEAHGVFCDHGAVENIAVADEVGHEGIGGFIVNGSRGADLLDAAVFHDDDGVAHGEGFFLVVCDIDKRNAEFAVHFFEFDLHFFTHFQVESAERFVEQKDFRLIDNGARNGDALLLTAGQSRNASFFKSFQIDDGERCADFFVDLFAGKLLQFCIGFALIVHVSDGNFFELQSERDVVVNVVVREQGITLEYRIDGAFVRGQIGNVFPAEQDLARSGDVKTCDHAQGSGFPAAGGPEEGNEFAFTDIKTDILYGCGFVEDLRNVYDFNDFFFFFQFCHFFILLAFVYRACDFIYIDKYIINNFIENTNNLHIIFSVGSLFFS